MTIDLKPSQELHGFTVCTHVALPEIAGEAYTLIHNKSGARLLYLKNDDNNKAFSIAFKTLPTNDTGVFHILEHSVLCGSKKFPVKEPFVNLLKSSMQTFLNAMTFPDKTLYPVASTNERDLLHLTDVYLDAVLHPMIYQKRAIFEQEGWHYELTDNVNSTPELTLNGVVYNEMKGALSDPNAVIYDALQAQLFPDTIYRFESGGTPYAIPDLTYEQFLEEHDRYYRLDNSYLTLYGNLDIDTMLAFLDEKYLSPVADEEKARDAKRIQSGKTAFTPPEISLQTPVKTLGVRQTMTTAPENACMALGYVIGTAHERTRIMAVGILIDAIAGSNEAPLKRALLDAGLADDIQAFLADSLLQPFAVIQLRGLAEGASRHFHKTVNDVFGALATGSLDHSLIEASLSHTEFVMRESNFGIADGVALSIAALSGWLYDDSEATSYLHYEDDFAYLRDALSKGYFEELIRSVFLENGHMTEVELVPISKDAEDAEAKRLATTAATMDAKDFSRIAQTEAELRRLQENPDSPEALATLPYLSVSDISTPPEDAPLSVIDSAPLVCLYHSVATHGIVYAYRYFDMNHLAFDDLPYAAILGLVLGKLDTASHTASELDTLVNAKLGNLSFFIEVHEDTDDARIVRPQFVVSSSALSKNTEYLGALPREIMLTTDFSDTAKIKDVLQQRRIDMEQDFSATGHISAMLRLTTYYLPSGIVRDTTGGIEFYRFLKNLLAHYDERAQDLTIRLTALAQRLFVDNTTTLSLAGAQKDCMQFWKAGGTLGRTVAKTQNLFVPAPVKRNEAFIIPSDVCYVASGFDRRAFNAPYNGAWQVAARALSYDYLWNEVRVKGGAYGSGFQAAQSGNMRFYSFRDPHIDETLTRFEKAAEWLAAFNPNSSEMDGYIVSTVAEFDAPLKARMLIRRQDADWFAKRSLEDRLRIRSQIIATDIDALHALSKPISQALKAHAKCAFGSKDILENSSSDFEIIDLLNE